MVHATRVKGNTPTDGHRLWRTSFFVGVVVVFGITIWQLISTSGGVATMGSAPAAQASVGPDLDKVDLPPVVDPYLDEVNVPSSLGQRKFQAPGDSVSEDECKSVDHGETNNRMATVLEAVLPALGSAEGFLENVARVDMSKILLKKEPKKLKEVPYCAVVGNSGSLMQGVPWGRIIDAHDVVIRMNTAPTRSMRTGTKTTFRLLNKAAAIAYSGYTNRPIPPTCSKGCPFEVNETLLLARGDAKVKSWLLKRFQPVYTQHAAADAHPVATVPKAEGVPAGSGLSFLGTKLLTNTKSVIAAYQRLKVCADAGIERGMNAQIAKAKTPSIGLVGMALAFSMCENVRLFGFGLFRGDYQYFRLRRRPNNQDHDFNLERGVLQILSRGDRLKLCQKVWKFEEIKRCAVPGMSLEEYQEYSGIVQNATLPEDMEIRYSEEELSIIKSDAEQAMSQFIEDVDGL